MGFLEPPDAGDTQKSILLDASSNGGLVIFSRLITVHVRVRVRAWGIE